jgi:GNAT superfamily N-acetyltransferase
VLTTTDNEQIVLSVLARRFDLPLDRLVPGVTQVIELPGSSPAVQAYAYRGGILAAAEPKHLDLVRDELADPSGNVRAGMARIAARLGGRPLAVVNRTGVTIQAPTAPVTVTDAADPRLPDWVRGHFTGSAWVVTGEDDRVLTTAVLKRYDERLREISVGTAKEARGRGLARAVVAAAALAVLAEGRAVLYNHDLDNVASAKVAESVGLHQFGVFHAVLPVGRDPG